MKNRSKIAERRVKPQGQVTSLICQVCLICLRGGAPRNEKSTKNRSKIDQKSIQNPPKIDLGESCGFLGPLGLSWRPSGASRRRLLSTTLAAHTTWCRQTRLRQGHAGANKILHPRQNDTTRALLTSWIGTVDHNETCPTALSSYTVRMSLP